VSLLRVRELVVHIRTRHGTARAVDGVDLTLQEGESVGVVGESGSGKTMLALSLLGLLPEGGRIVAPGSSILLEEQELVGLDQGELRRIRGGKIAMIFQEPMSSLNPVFTIGDQIKESVELHQGLTGAEANQETLRLLEMVGIPDPMDRVRSYPHQLSGGMRQRAMIAMALAGKPRLLIADEPTTALDVTVQTQILNLLTTLQRQLGMGLLLISHDLGVVSRVCQRIVVLYGGRVVESGSTQEILSNPRHPYTRGLLASRLSLEGRRDSLATIPGEVPEATEWPPGCRFHPRCGDVMDRCRSEEPPLARLGPDRGPVVGSDGGGLRDTREARCWLLDGAGGGGR
jgi:oligopeptide/dipeptide ABC transporter ATP-binding protein